MSRRMAEVPATRRLAGLAAYYSLSWRSFRMTTVGRHMEDHRSLMTAALKSIFVPALRERGFKGSLPHFYRACPARTDFLTVQFNSAGGSFVVEIAKCGPNGIESGHGEDLPVSKLNVQYFARRHRLGSNPAAGILDHWFDFAPRNYDPPQPLHPAGHYEHVASILVPLLDSQAEDWWGAC